MWNPFRSSNLSKHFSLLPQSLVTLATLVVPLLATTTARGELILIPESRHEQFLTYGLFIDQQSMLVMRDAGNFWGAVAGSLPLLEERDWAFRPQLLANASVNANFRSNDTHTTLLTQTFDARAGLELDLSFTESFRGAIGWTHQSGHISDNVPYPQLIGPNLGNELIWIRLIRDFDTRFRIGGTLRPIVGSDPAMKTFGADQFAEWFPWGQRSSPHSLSPYLAAGVEEYGRDYVQAAFHAQIGAVVGNHFFETWHPSLRIVAGYYTGPDPALKYYEFMRFTPKFFYTGFMFDI